MAEEPEINTSEEEEVVEPKPKKGFKVNKMIFVVPIAVILLVVQTVAAYFTVKKLFFDKMEAEIQQLSDSLFTGLDTTFTQTTDEVDIDDYEPTGLISEFEDIIVNPAGTEGRRYFVLTMSLEVNKKKALDELASKTPIIRDALITLLAGKTMDYITDVTNMESLRQDIMETTNDYLEKGKVIRVYFTGYVLQ